MTQVAPYRGANLGWTWPLAVSLAAHALLVSWWLHSGARGRAPDDTPRTLSVLLLPRPAPPPAPVIAPRRAPAPGPRGLQRQVAQAPAALPAARPQPDGALPAPRPQVPAVAGPSAWDILDAARQDMRKGGIEPPRSKAGALRQQDSAWTRFQEGVAAAHVDPTPGPVTESYTAADGLMYYRTRVGGKVVCRKTGSTGPPAPWRGDEAVRAGAGSAATLDVGNSAGTTLCPEGKRDWAGR
jgi:hypothetical protein